MCFGDPEVGQDLRLPRGTIHPTAFGQSRTDRRRGECRIRLDLLLGRAAAMAGFANQADTLVAARQVLETTTVAAHTADGLVTLSMS
jgi:hypothetical protein